MRLCTSSCNDDDDDDGICDDDEIPGCQDSEACNYNAAATDPANCNYPENNYDCDGNCLIETDCLGNCGGNASYDDCGICNGNGIPDGQCDCSGNVNDCVGICGGNASYDDCGECNGDGSSCNCTSDVCLNFDGESMNYATSANLYGFQI